MHWTCGLLAWDAQHASTKKIECYINVLMASPTDEQLQAACKADGKACINQWREAKYKSCEDVCAAADYEAGDYYMVMVARTELWVQASASRIKAPRSGLIDSFVVVRSCLEAA